jgi:hypothetical protein
MMKMQSKDRFQPRMQSAIFKPEGRGLRPFWVCCRVADFNPLAGASSRVCKALFSNPKAEV